MTAATMKRSKAKPRNPARARVKKISLVNRLFRTIPLSARNWQHLLTILLVAVALTGGIAIAWYQGVPQTIGLQLADAAADAGYEVKRVEVSGIERIDELKVYEITLAQKDRSMLLVDIDQVRADLLRYGWIKDARVSRRLPDTLVVELTERQPVAVWQRAGKLSLIDQSGFPLQSISKEEIGELPIIVGDGANLKIAELEKLLDAAPALRPLVSSAIWIGNRRWNLQFGSGETLALPEGRDTAAAAFLNFARMDGVNRLLGKGVVQFDLRDAERAYLRMPPKAASKDENAPADSGQEE